MLFLVLTNISVLLSKNHFQSGFWKCFLESKTEILVKTKNNIVLVYFVMIRLLVILFIIKLYAQKNIFKKIDSMILIHA